MSETTANDSQPPVRFTVNGAAVEVRTHPMERLLDAVRKNGLTGTKEGCGEGECGACGVLLDGVAVHREAHAASSSSAVIIVSGTTGTCRRRTPVACAIALTIAGAGPSIGSSPIPLAPPGPPAYGRSAKATRRENYRGPGS